MKIQSIDNYQVKNNYTRNQRINLQERINFKGLRGQGKSLFVLDLDGSFLHGITSERLNEFLDLQRKADAILAYATGQNLQKFTEKRAKLLAEKQISLPLPDAFLGRNGLFVFKNENGSLVESVEWTKKIFNSFKPEQVRDSANKVAFHPEYLMPNATFNNSTDFKNSKLCEFEFWGAPGRMIQFVADASISKRVLKDLKTQLKNDGLTARVMKQSFSREECERLCTPEQLAIINPRYGENGKMTQIDILGANKGDAEEFIQKQFHIPDEDVLMAGNDENDISMAKLAKTSDRNFVCLDKVGELFEYVISRENHSKTNVIIPQEEGISGIIEAIKKLLEKKNSSIC